MGGAHNTAGGSYEQKLKPGSNVLFYVMVAIGLVTMGAGLATDATRMWRSYLIGNMIFVGLGVGAMVFLVTHYLAASGWFVAIRRLPEAFASTLKYGCVTTLVLFAGLGKLYPWMNHELMHNDHLLHQKAGYFSTGFFAARVILFFIVVIFFAHKILQNSLRQDTEGGLALRDNQKRVSAAFLVMFAPLFTVFAINMVKSLEPKWFSTIFGVYMFSGFMQTTMAVMILTLFFLKRAGYLAVVREDHVHDMSKYMFGWSIFWAYIGFSQFMLIWYANLPEETFYYLTRMQGAWTWVGLVLLASKFILPFLLLLPRAAKRSLNYASVIACLVVVSEIIDLNWMVMPSYNANALTFGWQDIGILIGFAGLFGLGVRSFLAKHNMVPVKDPYLHESENHHVVYA